MKMTPPPSLIEVGEMLWTAELAPAASPMRRSRGRKVALMMEGSLLHR
jgi:hypothetical protein